MVSFDAILAMKKMAGDPIKKKALIKDATCIGGLVLVLSNPDPQIVQLALETLLLLADQAENQSILHDFIGMMDQLELVITKATCDQTIQSMAEKLYLLLSKIEETCTLKDTSNTSGSSRRSSCNKNRSLLGTHKSKALVLQLRGMVDKSDRDLCMRLLLQVKGVISITFDMKKMRCIVRSKLDVKPESLVRAIARSQTFAAQQVIKTDSGEELLVTFNAHSQELNKENNEELPEYLPDEEETVIDDKAVSRSGKGGKKSGAGWLSTAASFLTNSFYW
ncbi:hypothetical protein ACJMK2_040921 [Sinanodonta woodiana]|uniref:Armadillo repeat-containing protein 1 n=1 Tax=Sinanodonta woodiana TaxID=1069815 RepID=A0ABD3W2H6_SINWO